MPDGSPPPLIGRVREREAIADALDALSARPGVVVIEGEPGIGKSRLLEHLGADAGGRGCTVLDGRASEFEADLPNALWTDALDGHLARTGDRALARLGLADPAALAAVLPALAGVVCEPVHADRHRAHRALRDLLERLAGARPVVLCLDDVHWADPASVDALAALVRRPPAARVLLAMATRERQLPPALAAAVGDAAREGRVTLLGVAPLSRAEAVELVGDAGAVLYARAGGNPFYLEQLARVPGDASSRARHGEDASVPAVVAAALAAELAALSSEAHRLLDGAAVAGDPFDPGLAADVAGLPQGDALDALDELLARALVRPAGAPGRFAFRHPVVRHAVYVAAPAGWRLAAHARAAAALERRGADPVQRAHHVEQAASPGDGEAIALLVAAARAARSQAPATAARFHAAALRLLGDGAGQPARRAELQALLADARSAAGDAAGARETLLDALRTVEGASASGRAADTSRLALTVGLANAEWWLGHNESARRRLQVALAELPAEPSPDRVRLRLALSLTALLDRDLAEARASARDARDDARGLGDPVFELAALAGGAVAAVAADGADARGALEESAAAMERLSPDQQATRLPAFWMHGRARRELGELEAALEDLQRGAAIARDTGRENVLLLLVVESSAALVQLGRVAEATSAALEGVELARLAGNPGGRLWAHSALSSAYLAGGDVGAALRCAQEATEIPATADFYATGQPGWCLGAALTAAGNAQTAVPLMLEAFGGDALDRIVPVERPAAAGDLVEAQLACGDVAGAAKALASAEEAVARAGTPWSAAITQTACAGVLLAQGRPREAAGVAARAREAASAGPLASALAGLAEGKALAAAGQRRAAVQALIRAEAALDGFGALRRRDEAVSELRKLGHRVVRPVQGTTRGALDGLSAREQEIAHLVAAGRTNREVAEQLVLSPRTIEAHLRSIYGKLGVRSRVELAREAARRPDA